MDWKLLGMRLGAIGIIVLICWSIVIASGSSKRDIEKWQSTDIGKACPNQYKVQCTDCYIDCQDLGAKMLRYDSGGFGAARCSCRWDDEYKQIW